MSESSRPRRVASLREHTNYVQGVAWDPLGKYLCSLGADRTLRMYEWTRGGRRLVPCGCVSTHAFEKREEPDEAEDGIGAAGRDQTVATKSKPAPALRWFAGQGILHFFRRLAWSPDGQVLACPASLAYATDNSSSEKRDMAKVLKSRCHAVHVFARRHLHMPWGHLDGHGEPVIAVRFCPRRYHPVPAVEGVTTGEAFPPRTDRLVVAVATQTQVFLYDTQHSHPIARCAGLHLAYLTDMAWAPDASYLLVASLDGYLSKIRFDRENELGTELETADVEAFPRKRAAPTGPVDSTARERVGAFGSRDTPDPPIRAPGACYRLNSNTAHSPISPCACPSHHRRRGTGGHQSGGGGGARAGQPEPRPARPIAVDALGGLVLQYLFPHKSDHATVPLDDSGGCDRVRVGVSAPATQGAAREGRRVKQGDRDGRAEKREYKRRPRRESVPDSRWRLDATRAAQNVHPQHRLPVGGGGSAAGRPPVQAAGHYHRARSHPPAHQPQHRRRRQQHPRQRAGAGVYDPRQRADIGHARDRPGGGVGADGVAATAPLAHRARRVRHRDMHRPPRPHEPAAFTPQRRPPRRPSIAAARTESDRPLGSLARAPHHADSGRNGPDTPVPPAPDAMSTARNASPGTAPFRTVSTGLRGPTAAADASPGAAVAVVRAEWDPARRATPPRTRAERPPPRPVRAGSPPTPQ
eukprot:ctg_110.g56